MSTAEGIEIMDNESTFTATDQLEREIIWNALAEYKAQNIDTDNGAVIDELIERVTRTFSWAR